MEKNNFLLTFFTSINDFLASSGQPHPLALFLAELVIKAVFDHLETSLA